MASVLTAIIHYQTPDLLQQAVESFRRHEASAPLLVLDNGSNDGSAQLVASLPDRFDGLSVKMMQENCFHGPAMDLVLKEAREDCVFFLDSDTITHKGGFLEPMAAQAAAPDQWACGQVTRADSRGFASDVGTPVPVSAFMMINRALYCGLPPFIHHGLPVLQASQAARARGLTVADFPVEQYVEHLGRGTAERFGYGLGWRSRLNYLMHRLGI
ncbi:MAG: GT2 family glycosyltransferase [Rhodothermales bacterium]|jgi:GT2 family glycosyltransferase